MWKKMLVLDPGDGVEGTLVFDKLVDMVLGPMLAGGDFKDESNNEQSLLGVPACDHLGAGQGDSGGQAAGVEAKQTLSRLRPWGSVSSSERWVWPLPL